MCNKINLISCAFLLFVLFGTSQLLANDTEAAADSAECKECTDWNNLHPDWIFCDDFESGLPMKAEGRYFEYGDDDGDCVVVDTVGYHNSKGIRVIFQPGEVGAGGFKLAFGRNPINYMNSGIYEDENFREIYYRMYLKNQKGWEGNPAKLSRATSFTGSNWSQAMIAHLWSDGKGNLLTDPASGIDEYGNVITIKYNDFENLIWLGNKSGVTPIFTEGYDDKWYCIEAHVRLNDPGAGNGIQEFWIDNNIEARMENLNFVGTYTDFAINAVFFENWWNNGSPKLQERYFDNIVVSRSRIGCGCSPLNISTDTLSEAVTNIEYSDHLKADGGFPPFTWELISGDLPAGLSLNSATGEIAGITNQAGAHYFEVGIMDSDVSVHYDTAYVSLIVHIPSSSTFSASSKTIEIAFNGNSFDNLFNIGFEMDAAAQVQLVIYNSIGLYVDSIIDNYRAAGYHHTEYNAGALSAGVYFYCFRTGKHFQSGKFIIYK